jgi:hypothetical protein
MVRIEILMDFKDDGPYYKDEIRRVTREKAGYFCGLGWARALDDAEIKTGTPDTTPKKLTVPDGKHTTKPSNPGVK